MKVVNDRTLKKLQREEESLKEISEVKAIIDLLKEKDKIIRNKCDFLQTMIDSLPNPVYTKDKDCKYKMCNKAFMISFGVSEESIIGKTIVEIYPENEVAKKMYESDLNLLKSGGVSTLEVEINSKILLLNRTVYRDDKGEIVGIIGSGFDITDRVKKEKQLKLEQEKFFRAFDKSPIPKIITKYGTGQLLEINESCLELLGFTRDEVVGQCVYDIVTDSGKPLIKDFKNITIEYFLNKLNEKGKITDVEFEIYKKNDEQITLQLFASKYPVNGGFCILTILKDITERKIAQEKIIKAKEEWEATFNVVPELIAILDTEHNILRVNKSFADKFDNKQEYFIGKKCHEIIHGLGYPPDECPHSQLMIDGYSHTTEVYEELLDSYFIVTCSPLFDEHNNLFGSDHSMFDITEKKKIELKLAESVEQYKVAIELSNDAVAITQGNKHVFINKRYLEIFGLKSEDEVIGKDYINVYPSDITFVKDLNKRRCDGLKVPNKYEFRGVRADNGNVIKIEVSAAKISYKGKVATLAYLRDVTDRKKYEQFQDLPLTILDNTPEMICRHDPLLKFTYTNDTYCKFVGKTREELKEITLFEFTTPDELNRLVEYFKSFSVNKTTDNIINKVKLVNDEVVYIYWMNKAFFNSDGELTEIQSIGRVSDVFDLK